MNLCPGLILGQYGVESGREVTLYPYGPKVYDKKGKEQNGIWSRTRANGLYYIEFQWDAVEIARMIDPEYARFRVLCTRGSGYRDEFHGPFYLVVNVKYLLKRGTPILKDAPPRASKWIDEIMKFVKENSTFADTVLKLATIITQKMRTTEMYCATGFVAN